jgi:tetratricopeptide (TPR) repeat protein
MAEDAPHIAGSGPNAAADAIALGAQGPLDPRAAAYLEEQTRLAKLQSQNLIDQNAFELSHLRFRRFSDYSKMALEMAAGLLLLAIVCGLGIMVWSALHDDALTIEAFSVPPDLAARGFTGQAVAADLLDKFAAMEARTLPTAQTQGTYRLDAGESIRIAIPDTGGLSLGEIDRYLRDTLGHETHVTGEVVRAGQGLTVMVRAGGKPGTRFDGADADLDGLMQKAAEALFRQFEPLRYADYLADQNRFGEVVAVLRPLSLSGPPLSRARALTSWAEALDFDGDARDALPVIEQAVAQAPKASFAWAVDSDIQNELGHDEAAHAAEMLMTQTASATWSAHDLAASQFAYLPYYIAQRRHAHEGDYAASAEDWNRMDLAGGSGLEINDAGADLLERAPQLAAQHDISAARQEVVWESGVPGDSPQGTAYADAAIAFYTHDWPAVVKDGALLEAAKGDPYDAAWQRVQVRPLRAIAMARLGDFAGASALIGKTSRDCDLCLRARGQIDALEKNWAGAAHWFAIVASRSPDIPFADADWGQMLLAKGDADAAVAKFKIANEKGPRFADPLEMWGEALIAKNRSDLALAKFAEATKYAPNWGRLHVKWGEALYWSGDKADAATQFAIARRLDLTPPEKSELANVSHR